MLQRFEFAASTTTHPRDEAPEGLVLDPHERPRCRGIRRRRINEVHRNGELPAHPEHAQGIEETEGGLRVVRDHDPHDARGERSAERLEDDLRGGIDRPEHADLGRGGCLGPALAAHGHGQRPGRAHEHSGNAVADDEHLRVTRSGPVDGAHAAAPTRTWPSTQV